MKRALKNIETSEKNIVHARERLAAAQERCTHVWCFDHQINAYHKTIWRIFYTCTVCRKDEERKGIPVCAVCVPEVELVRATAEDKKALEALATLKKPFFGTKIVYRCPTCEKIHILTMLGN